MLYLEAQLGTCQISMMEFFCENGLYLEASLDYFPEILIIDTPEGRNFAFVIC